MYCYSPTKEDALIGQVNGWTPHLTAIIRGIYDERMEEDGKPKLDQSSDLTDTDQVIKAAETLRDFNNEGNKKRFQHMSRFHNVRTPDLRTATQHYTPEDLSHRLSAIGQHFRSIVFQLQQITGRSIAEICNGYYDQNNRPIAGQFAIFEKIYGQILANAEYNASEADKLSTIPENERSAEQQAALEEYNHYAEEYTKMIHHWDELVTLTRSKLRDSMGILLGNKVEYAQELGIDMAMEALHFDVEESHREHWLEKQDEISAFDSMFNDVRIFLGNQVVTDENGNPVFDDLGYPVLMDPTQAHQELMDILRGMRSSKQMEKKLLAAADNIPWIRNLYKELYRRDIDNSCLRTRLFIDFRKSHQLYGALEKTMKEGHAVYKTFILNRVKDAIKGNTRARVVRGLVLDEKYSLYTSSPAEFTVADPNPKKKGKLITRKGAAINIANFNKFVNDVGAHLKEREDEHGRVRTMFDDSRRRQKVNFLARTFKALGIEVSDKSIEKLLNNKNDTERLIKRLNGIYGRFVNESQFNTFLGKKAKTSLELNEDWEGYTSYLEFLEDETFAEHFDELSAIITKYSANQEFENKAFWKDANGNNITLFSDVQSSYLADKIDDVKSFVEAGDHEGLVNYLHENWGVSSYFFDKTANNGMGRYLNRWMHELVTGGFDSDSFARQFDFMKFIGETDRDRGITINFENFTNVKHIIAIMSEFSSLRQISNGKSRMGRTPVFILGDANVQKFITAPIYPLLTPQTIGGRQVINAQTQTVTYEGGRTVAPIIDGLWDVFNQEQTMWEIAKKMKETMEEEKPGKPSYSEVVTYKAKSTVAGKAGYKGDSDAVKEREDISEAKKEKILKLGTFQFLTFLNEDYVPASGRESEKGKFYRQLIDEALLEDGTFDKAKVMKILEYGMDDAFRKFKDRLVDAEVLTGNRLANTDDSTRLGKYDTYSDTKGLFTQDVNMVSKRTAEGIEKTDDARLDEFLREFFWNTKFATIQQMQMFTISPIFYKDTKELQKRYKELHAPGNALDIYAEFWNGTEYERYSDDGVETVVYFNDIALNAEKYNPEYARAVAYHYGLMTKEIRDALKEGADLNDSEFVEKVVAAGRKTDGYKTYAHERKFNDKGEDITEGEDANSLTDGQAYRSLDSYRKVMGMAGLWTNEMESFYRNLKELRMQYGKDIPQEQINDLVRKSNVVFQPIKPYMYGIEQYKFDNDTGLIPVQHKYSEAVLIPELLPKNSKLREMAMWMEDRNVDLLASSYVVKTGQWGSVDIKGLMNTRDESGNLTESLLSDALDKAAVHKFNYGDYRIQTNVPDHSNTDRLFGTQLRKLIMANLKMGDDRYSSYLHGAMVNLGGNTGMVKLTGRNLLAFYNSIIVSNILDSLEDFANEINDADKLADVLTQSIVNNSRFSMNCIDAFAMTGDSRFMMPLFEAAFEHDTASMIFSIFKNRVNRQKIRGGSAVQKSALGINEIKSDEAEKFGVDYGGLKDRVSLRDNTNVIFSEIAKPFNFSVTDTHGNEVPLKYEDWVDDNGIPYFGVVDEKGRPVDGKYGRDLTEEIENLKKHKDVYSDEEYERKLAELQEEEDLCQSFTKVIDGKSHIFMPAIETQYKNILTLIAYRIPTENDYSMVMGRIVRFTRPTAGGVMYVPAHGTQRSGWDFDIDKLYFMMFEYSMKKGNLDEVRVPEYFREKYNHLKEDALKRNYVWARWYKANPEQTEMLESAQENLFDVLHEIENSVHNFNMMNEDVIDILQSATNLDANSYDSLEQFVEVVKDLHSRNPFDDYKPGDGKPARQVSDLIEEAEGYLEDRVVTKDDWVKVFKEELTEEEFNVIKDHITDDGVDSKSIKELYKYWELAGLTGKPSQAFQSSVDNIVGTRFEEYDTNKTALDNSRVARNNMLLTIIQKRLMDKETFMARNTPSEFVNASRGARNLRELTMGDYKGRGWYDERTGEFDEEAFEKALKDKTYDPEPNYDPTDPWTIIVYNAQNQLAAKLIGIMANQNANHALATLMDELRLNEPIEFCGHSLSTDGIGADLLHKYLSDDIMDSDPERAERIRKNVAEFLAASVDAVKDPVLNFLNLNTLTAAPGLLLARLGYTPEEIGLLFNQPIVKEICKEYFADGFRNADTVVNKVISKYYDKKTDRDNNSEKDFGKDALRLNIVKHRIASEKGVNLMNMESGRNTVEGDRFIDSQVRIAEMFSKVLRASAELNSFITATKFTAANAVGTTPGAFYNQQMRIQKYLNDIEEAEQAAKELVTNPNSRDEGPKRMLSMVVSGVFDESTGRVISGQVTRPVLNGDNLLSAILDNKEQYIQMVLNNPFAYEQAMFDANRKCIQLVEQYYPYGTKAYSLMRDKGNRLMSNGMLREDEINALHQEWMVYLLSQQDGSIFNGGEMMSVTRDGKRVSNRDYYLHYFAEEVHELLENHQGLKDLPIFSAMNFDVDVRGVWSMRILGGISRADYSRDEIIDSWDQLSKMGEGGKELAKRLFMYCFYNHGFRYGSDNFIYMCPVSVKESLMVTEGTDGTDGISYRDFLYSVLDETVNMRNININDFYKMFIANHSADYRWVYRPYGDTKKSLEIYLTETNPQFALEDGKLSTVVPKGQPGEGDTVTSFTLDLSMFDDNADIKQFLRNDKEAAAENRYAFVPAIMIGDNLYIADGNLFNITDGDAPVMTYRLYETLGGRGENMWYLSPTEADNLGWRRASEQQEHIADERTEGRPDNDVELSDPLEGLSRDELIERYVNKVAEVYEQEYNVSTGLRQNAPSIADKIIVDIITDLKKTIARENTTEERIKSILKNIEEKDCRVKNENGLWVRPC